MVYDVCTTKQHKITQGYLAASHVQYEQATSTSYNYTLDFPRGKGLYHVFCIPDDDAKGRLLASIPATPVYIHRFVRAYSNWWMDDSTHCEVVVVDAIKHGG